MSNTELITRFNSAFFNAFNKFYNGFQDHERNLFEKFEKLFLNTDLTNDDFILKVCNNTLTLNYNNENINNRCWRISIKFLISMFYIYIKLNNPQLKTCQITFTCSTNENYFLYTYVLDLDTLKFNLHFLNSTNSLQFPTNNIYTFVFPSFFVIDVKNNIFSKQVLQQHIDNNNDMIILYNSLKIIYFHTLSFEEKEWFEDFQNLFCSLNSILNSSNPNNNINSSKFKLFINNAIIVNHNFMQETVKIYNFDLKFKNNIIVEKISIEFLICFLIFCFIKVISNDRQQAEQETEFYITIRTRRNNNQVYKFNINNLTITQANNHDTKYYFSLPCFEIDNLELYGYGNNLESSIYNNNDNDFLLHNENNNNDNKILSHNETKNYSNIIQKNYRSIRHDDEIYDQVIRSYFKQLNLEEVNIFKDLSEILDRNVYASSQKSGLKYCITDAKAEIVIHLEQENYEFSNRLMQLCCKSFIWLLFSSFKEELSLFSSTKKKSSLIEENKEELLLFEENKKEIFLNKIMVYISSCNEDELIPNLFSLDIQTLDLEQHSHYDVIQEQKKNYTMRKKFVSVIFENAKINFLE